jgi:hypothetical protein
LGKGGKDGKVSAAISGGFTLTRQVAAGASTYAVEKVDPDRQTSPKARSEGTGRLISEKSGFTYVHRTKAEFLAGFKERFGEDWETAKRRMEGRAKGAGG